jgi:hypothetical protein
VTAGYAESSISKLKYAVSNPGKSTLTFTGNSLDGTSFTTAANSTDDSAATDKSSYVVTPAGTSATTTGVVRNILNVSTAATVTSTVTVTAFIDSNLDGKINNTATDTVKEWTAAPVTITFNKASEVTWTTEFTKPVLGDTKYVAYVSASPSINVGQIADAHVDILLSETVSSTTTTDLVSPAYDATSGKLKFNNTSATIGAVVAGRYAAQASYDGTTASSSTLVGSEVAYAVAAATVGSVEAPATTASDDLKVATAPTAGSVAGVTTVRATATKVPVSILVKDTSAVALKDTAVTVYVAEAAAGGTDTSATAAIGNFDTSTFVAGGKTLQDTSDKVQVISFAATSDADGKVLFDLVSAAKNGDSVVIWASAQNVNVSSNVVDGTGTALSNATNRTTYNWTTAAPATVVNNDVQGTSAVLQKAKGSTFTLNFTVLDQFGAAIPTADKYRVAVSDNNAYDATGNDQYSSAAIAGKASVSYTLASTYTGTKTYSFKTQVKGDNGNYTDSTGSGSVQVVVGSVEAAAKVTVTADLVTAGTATDALSTTATNTPAVQGTRTSVLDTTAFVAGDKNLGATNTVKGTTTTGVLLAGTVTDATSATTYSTVTISGANVNFIVGGTLYAAGSVTVQTNASGAFAGVRVVSNKSGKQTITVKAGSASNSYVIDFGAAADNAGTSLTLTAPASIASGRTLTVSALLADKFGNGVNSSYGVNRTELTVAYTGPGLVIGSLPTATDADGKLTFNVLLGATDVGTATVTVTYGAANRTISTSDTAAADIDLVKTATITVGAVAAAVEPTSKIGTANSRVYVNVKDGKGAVVTVKIGAKWYTKSALNNDYTFSFKAKKKSKVSVKVYVDGDLSSSKTITVK